MRSRASQLLAWGLVLGLAGCLSMPKDQQALKSQFPREVTVSFDASLDEVLASFLESSQICGKAWRESIAAVVGWVSAPTFKPVHHVSADRKAATLEIWSMNALSPDYLFELIELREAVPGLVDVVHFQGKPHESPKTLRPKDLATWHGTESPTCQ